MTDSESVFVVVAPLVGAWIEIIHFLLNTQDSMSLPLWERGLKFQHFVKLFPRNAVAPLVGAWIEIAEAAQYAIDNIVAPLVGAWIEIVSLQL